MTSTNMSVLIVDDEPVARQRLRRLLSEMEGVQLIGECKNGRDAVAKIIEDRPDLVLLDVQMPMMDGFAVLRSLPEDAMPIVVFVTAFDEHATAAFDVHALDYVVKPVEAERFRVAVERARGSCRWRAPSSVTSGSSSSCENRAPVCRRRASPPRTRRAGHSAC